LGDALGRYLENLGLKGRKKKKLIKTFVKDWKRFNRGRCDWLLGKKGQGAKKSLGGRLLARGKKKRYEGKIQFPKEM